MVKKVDKKTAFGGGLAVAGATQLSRNKRVRNAGGIVLYATIMGAIGEFIGFLIKWIIVKPCILIAKGCYYATIWSCKMIWKLTVLSYKWIKIGIIKLYQYIKFKREKKIVE